MRTEPIAFLPAIIFSALLAIAFIVFYQVDLSVAAWFYAPVATFPRGDSAFAQFWYVGVQWARNWIVIPVSLLFLILLAVRRRLPFGIPTRAFLLVLLTFVLGSWILVNEVLKGEVGRARPRQIEQFGGDKEFTPAFVISDECDRNCSFVSGHASFVFTGYAAALLTRRRKWAIAAVTGLGGMAGLGRMMQGAHFLSDIVFAGVFMFLVAAALHYLLFRRASTAREAA